MRAHLVSLSLLLVAANLGTPEAGAATYANPFYATFSGVNAVVNGTYELLLNGKCNIHAEVRLGDTTPDANTLLTDYVNISIVPNLLCVPTVSIINSTPYAQPNGLAGYYTYGVISGVEGGGSGFAGDTYVEEIMTWWWNGVFPPDHGYPCGAPCGGNEDVWHQASTPWRLKPVQGALSSLWTDFGCYDADGPWCDHDIGAAGTGHFEGTGGFTGAEMILESRTNAYLGFPDANAGRSCMVEINSANVEAYCKFAYDPPW